ncbi:uncharacterized protein LOC142985476 [Anticarsia gemmatalis]|uniref:uncharacterized protein LOC142985476 n=1 Tax=Anticarsia gemmatalis TaxID=129554 RepID=UPI003F77403E
MYLYTLCVFVFSLTTSLSKPSDKKVPIINNKGYGETVKLINLINKVYDNNDKNYKVKEENKETVISDPALLESMKLLQKNYDANEKFEKEKNTPRIHYIGNPEVLEIYKKQNGRSLDENNDGKAKNDRLDKGSKESQKESVETRMYFLKNPEVLDEYKKGRRHHDDYDFGTIKRSYAQDVKNRISYHYIKNPEVLRDYRKFYQKDSGSRATDESSGDENNKSDSYDNEDVRRNIQLYREGTSSRETSAVEKSEEHFDLVEPLIDDILNKYKGTQLVDKKDKKGVKNLEFELPNKEERTQKEESKNAEENKIKKHKTHKRDFLDENRKHNKHTKIKSKRQIKNKTKNSGRKHETKYSNEKKLKSGERLPKKPFLERSLNKDDGWVDKGFGWGKENDWSKKEKPEDSPKDWAKVKKKRIVDSDEKPRLQKKKREDLDKRIDKTEERGIWTKKKIKNNKKERLSREISLEREKKKNDWKKADHFVEKHVAWDKDDGSKEKNNKWNKKEESWNNKKEENWNKKEQSWNNDKREDSWNKKDDRWNKKANNWDKKDEGLNKKENIWNKKEDDWNKKDNSWNKREDSWNKKDKDWNKKEDNWNKKENDWNKKENDWNKREDNWNKKDNDWNKKEESWNKKAESWNKKDSWEKKSDWDKKEDNWNKKNDWNKKPEAWNNRELKIDNFDNKRDSAWDLIGLNEDISPKKNSYKNKNQNTEWGNYNVFKKIDKEISEGIPYEPKIVEKAKKNDWDTYVPKIPVMEYERPRKRLRYGDNEKYTGKGLGRTPIPFVGNKPVYAD